MIYELLIHEIIVQGTNDNHKTWIQQVHQ